MGNTKIKYNLNDIYKSVCENIELCDEYLEFKLAKQGRKNKNISTEEIEILVSTLKNDMPSCISRKVYPAIL